MITTKKVTHLFPGCRGKVVERTTPNTGQPFLLCTRGHASAGLPPMWSIPHGYETQQADRAPAPQTPPALAQPAIVSAWRCPVHLEVRVSWRGTGCPACAADRRRHHLRKLRRRQEAAAKNNPSTDTTTEE